MGLVDQQGTVMGRAGNQIRLRSDPSVPVSPRATVGRRRNRSVAGFDSSPDSLGDAEEEETVDGRKRLPGVKRACNECRQQKLRCDVVEEPFSQCSRCQRLRLQCKIESNFKRVGKRSRNAEMERELAELRQRLAFTSAQSPTDSIQPPSTAISSAAVESPESSATRLHPGHQMGSDEVVASLLDLRQGIDGAGGYMKGLRGPGAGARTIEGLVLPEDRILELFNQFFTFYHPLLPLLDPFKPPDYYYTSSPLLFWAIISIASRRFSAEPTLLTSLAPAVSRLTWSTLGDIPQSYHVVKALCLLCSWPFPVGSTSTDPTFMLCGLMMNVAMQMGLHRPSYAQDFARFHVQLREEDIRDRVKTWAACNIVAQSVGTGYGLGQSTLYDWTLEPSPSMEASYRLPKELEDRVRIEMFCDKVTKSLYSNRCDPVGLTKDSERCSLYSVLARDFEDLEIQLGKDLSAINTLHLRAAELHLRLSAFFDTSTTKSYLQDLLRLYFATTSYLNHVLSIEISNSGLLSYATNYILQMMIAGGFTLHKLLNSFFAAHVNLDEGKDLFHKTIWAIRGISVLSNDLPARLAEVLAQLWRNRGGGGAGLATERIGREGELDGSLTLKVRCRMSVSLVFDSVWRWREEFQAKGHGNLDSAVKNPTNPDSSADSTTNPSSPSSSIASTTAAAVTITAAAADPSLAPPPPPISSTSASPSGTLTSTTATPHHHHHLGGVVAASTPGSTSHPANNHHHAQAQVQQGGGGVMLEPTYEVFDPLNWMLDGLVDFPYSLGAMQDLEA